MLFQSVSHGYRAHLESGVACLVADCNLHQLVMIPNCTNLGRGRFRDEQEAVNSSQFYCAISTFVCRVLDDN